MNNNNMYYVITPPDLKLSLPNKNLSVLILGEKSKDIQKYISVYDHMFPELEIIFYHSNDGMTEDNVAWYKAVVFSCPEIIVNLDNLNTGELFFVSKLDTSGSGGGQVHWFSENKKNNLLKNLIVNFDNMVFESVKQFELYMEMAKKSS